MASALGESGRKAGPGPGDELGRYRIKSLLGEGGMGKVFEAEHPGLERTVALKVLKADMAHPQAKIRFLQEARNAARLRHPNIVTIHDFDEADGAPFIVMEHLTGETLAESLARAPDRRLSAGDAWKVLGPVFDAIAYAHEHKIIHRDLKPENVFLVARGRQTHPMVLDFGIAKAVGDPHSRTATGQIMGTLRYMSPEQINSAKNAGIESDQYALGAIVYECVTGLSPIGEVEGLSLPALIHKISYDRPEPIAKIAPDVPAGFVTAVARMLEKAPGDRFRTIQDAANALRDSVEGGDLPEARFDGDAAVARPAIPRRGASSPIAVTVLHQRGGDPHATGGIWSRPIPWIVVVFALVAAGILSWRVRRSDNEVSRPTPPSTPAPMTAPALPPTPAARAEPPRDPAPPASAAAALEVPPAMPPRDPVPARPMARSSKKAPSAGGRPTTAMVQPAAPAPSPARATAAPAAPPPPPVASPATPPAATAATPPVAAAGPADPTRERSPAAAQPVPEARKEKPLPPRPNGVPYIK